MNSKKFEVTVEQPSTGSKFDIEVHLPMHDGGSSSMVFFGYDSPTHRGARAFGRNNRKNKNTLPVSSRDLGSVSRASWGAFASSARLEIANISARRRSYLLLGLTMCSVAEVAALNNSSPFGNLSLHSVLNFWGAFWMLFPSMIFFTIFIFCAIAILVLVSTKGSGERFAYPTLLSLLAFLCCIAIFSQSSESIVQCGSFSFPLPLFVIFEALALFLTFFMVLIPIVYLAWLCKQREKAKE